MTRTPPSSVTSDGTCGRHRHVVSGSARKCGRAAGLRALQGADQLVRGAVRFRVNRAWMKTRGCPRLAHASNCRLGGHRRTAREVARARSSPATQGRSSPGRISASTRRPEVGTWRSRFDENQGLAVQEIGCGTPSRMVVLFLNVTDSDISASRRDARTRGSSRNCVVTQRALGWPASK